VTTSAIARRRSFTTRIATICCLAVILCAAASGQSPASAQYAYGLDPFNPRDAWLLRNYGSVLVAQTPILELRKLDPFKPSDAALLRDLGGAIPLWTWWYGPAPLPPSVTYLPPETRRGGLKGAKQITIVVGQLPPGDAAKIATPAEPPQTRAITALRPETNDGMWISYAGRRWVSAGRAIRFDESLFTRIGEYDGVPVFRRRDAGDDVIYLPTRPDLVAPYRAKVG
jgi:hypothetical protein